MLNIETYNKWTNFINDDKYIIYFMSDTYVWKIKLEQIKSYINVNDKKPSTIDKNKEIKSLSEWCNRNQYLYKTKKQIMSNEELYNIWTNFINDDRYKKYFKSNESLNNEDVIIEQTKKKVIKSKK